MEVVVVLFFLTAFGLGIAFCALPGAVTTQVIRRGLEHGFLAALFLQLGALVGVALWAIMALSGAAMLMQNRLARLMLSTVGVLFLLWLTWNALRDAYLDKVAVAKAPHVRGDFALGAILSLANPGAIAFWLGIGSTMMATGKASPDPRELAVFLLGFLAGALVWRFSLASLIAWGHRFVTPLFFRLVNLICGLALGFFALKLLWSALILLKG